MTSPLRALRSPRFLLLASSLATALAGAELVLRAFYPCPWYGYRFEAPQRGWFQYDPLLGWRGRPGATGVFAGPDYRVTVTHDARGHRGSAVPAAAGRRNVVAVGDSFGWGWGVEDEEVFSERMMAADPALNVYNLSAPGYGTDQQYLALGELLEGEIPAPLESVVLLLNETDFDDVAEVERYRYPKPRFELAGDGLRLANTPVPPRAPEAWGTERALASLGRSAANRLHLYNLVRNRFVPLRAAAAPRRPREPRPPRDERELRRALEVHFRLLRAIQALAAPRGAVLHVVLLELEPDPRWAPLRRFLADAEIRFTRFRPARFPRARLWLDGHLNARGHRVLAEHVLEALSDPAR